MPEADPQSARSGLARTPAASARDRRLRRVPVSPKSEQGERNYSATRPGGEYRNLAGIVGRGDDLRDSGTGQKGGQRKEGDQ